MAGFAGFLGKKDIHKTKRDLNKALDIWQIERLKYKCSITLLGLLEGQTSKDNVTRMVKSLQVKILKDNIADIFTAFDKRNGKKATPYT